MTLVVRCTDTNGGFSERTLDVVVEKPTGPIDTGPLNDDLAKLEGEQNIDGASALGSMVSDSAGEGEESAGVKDFKKSVTGVVSTIRFTV